MDPMAVLGGGGAVSYERGTPVGFGVLDLGVQGLGLRPRSDLLAHDGKIVRIEGLGVAEDHVQHHATRPMGGLRV